MQKTKLIREKNRYKKSYIGKTFIVLSILFFIGFVYAASESVYNDPTPGNGTYNTATSRTINMTYNGTDWAYSVLNFDNSLIGWWRFEGNATHHPHEFGTLNATCTTTCPALNSSGRFNQSVTFDGINDQFTFATTNNEFNLSGKNLTISVWHYRNLNGVYGRLFERHLNGGSYGGYWIQVNNDNRIQFSTSDNVGGVTSMYSVGTLQAGQWYHIVATLNGTTGTIYVNGVINSTDGAMDTISGVTAGLFTIGGSPAVFTNGTIDDLLVYSKALSLAEIKTLYNSTANPYYFNYTNLASGKHNFTGYSVNTTGVKTTAQSREFFVGNIIDFISPTPTNYSANGVLNTINMPTYNLAYSFVDINNTIIGWWRFNNASGENSTFFKSENGKNNATCSTCPIVNNSGYLNSSLTFDGIDDVINVAYNESYDLDYNYDNFTISFWIYPKSTPAGNGQGILGRFASPEPLKYFYMTYRAGRDVFFQWAGQGYSVRTIDSTGLLPLNAWSLVTFTHNTTNDCFYINGTFDKCVSTTAYHGSTRTPFTKRALQFGNIGSGTATYFLNASLDEVLFIKRTLTTDEISSLYSANANQFNHAVSFPNNTLATILGYGVDASTTYIVQRIFNISDVIYPSFSNTFVSPDSQTALGSATVTFSTDVTNTNGSVFVFINGSRNYATATGGDTYEATVNLGYGSYSYYWGAYGSGSNTNYAQTSNSTYIINQSSANPYFYITPTVQQVNSSNGFSFNLSGTDDGGTVTYSIVHADRFNVLANKNRTVGDPSTQSSMDRVGDTIYLFGGNNGALDHKNFSTYNITSNTWSNLSVPATMSARQSFCLRTYQDKVYILGGKISGAELNDFWEYNPSTNVWTNLTNMTFKKEDFGCDIVGDTLYALSGLIVGYNVYEVEAYNFTSQTWTIKNNVSFEHFRWSGEYATKDIRNNETIYIVGSVSNFFSDPPYAQLTEQRKTVIAYNTTSDTYTTISTDMPVPAAYKEVDMIGDELFVISGANGTATTGSKLLQAFNVTSRTWRIAPANLSWVRVNTAGLSTSSYNNEIYVTGGENVDGFSSASVNIVKYNPYQKHFFSISQTGNITSAQTLQEGMYAVQVRLTDSDGYTNDSILLVNVTYTGEQPEPPVPVENINCRNPTRIGFQLIIDLTALALIGFIFYWGLKDGIDELDTGKILMMGIGLIVGVILFQASATNLNIGGC